jgi:hypothetical protein
MLPHIDLTVFPIPELPQFPGTMLYARDAGFKGAHHGRCDDETFHCLAFCGIVPGSGLVVGVLLFDTVTDKLEHLHMIPVADVLGSCGVLEGYRAMLLLAALPDISLAYDVPANDLEAKHADLACAVRLAQGEETVPRSPHADEIRMVIPERKLKLIREAVPETIALAQEMLERARAGNS